jgi:PIN domain nuclease of toxin-antitoxin system
MDLVLDRRRGEVPGRPEAVILLDTNAVIWLDQSNPRTRTLTRGRMPLYMSPATLLELQFLEEAGRIRLRKQDAQTLAVDDRWLLDDPPAAAWFALALDLTWTRDPFDRLIAAHAQFRGWRLATSDAVVLEALGPRRTLAL